MSAFKGGTTVCRVTRRVLPEEACLLVLRPFSSQVESTYKRDQGIVTMEELNGNYAAGYSCYQGRIDMLLNARGCMRQ